MNLSKQHIPSIYSDKLTVPTTDLFSLPEKVLQFGTGVLLRGLPDYYIDKANRHHLFNGRIVVVKSTTKGGDAGAFARQDNLYTLCIRGIQNGQPVDEKIINSSISRVLSANEEWPAVLECAANKDIRIIISNTTEVGIVLHKEDLMTDQPPASYPGKLLAFLKKRFDTFNGSAESGMVIIPTELISGNGTHLKSICLKLAQINNFDTAFITWLTEANDFCNTLVDRIVPGALPAEDKHVIETELGYTDELMIMAEPYSLWAIETSKERTKELVSFSKADQNIILTGTISKYKEIKLRLLNGTHTLSCALALFCGYSTVKEAMQNETFREFVKGLLYREIIPATLNEDIPEEEAKAFAARVIDRFSNPFIAHEWINICAQYTLKINGRTIPLLLNFYKRQNRVPRHMALGFAAYLLFMRSTKNKEKDTCFEGSIQAREYTIHDDKAAILYKHWNKTSITASVHSMLSDTNLWGTNLAALPDFEKNVIGAMEVLTRKGGIEAILQKELITL